ncbi:MAG: zinc-binding alcohol dehydrogenase family protein [Enterococcaceae bacterium]|jgi:zinc-binding alcohol dehydrogenase family protein|nr:zinc-binding alcohol dehydrogenase family protein [Enterococcaceae bacterium]MCI1919160.1 zinc-binding alcohol dehydrogenase family protein [Enterococcaceae bacterium]
MKTNAISFAHPFLLSEGNLFRKIEMELPPLGEHDLLVDVEAISVNPVDTKLRQAGTDLPDPPILGYDAVGIVTAKGAAVQNFTVGDEVMYAGSTKRLGSYSEKQVVDARIAAHAPAECTIAEIAGLPLTFLVAYEVLFEKIGLIPEEGANQGVKLLIINGAGGAGSAAVQLAKWSGATVIATASRTETIDWVTRLGADLVIDHHKNITQQLKAQAISLLPAILILHSTDEYFDEMAGLVAPFGHVASIVETAQPHQLDLLKNKSASWDWEYMFVKTDFDYQVATQGAILEKVSRLLEAKKIRPTTTKVLHGLTPETLFAAHQTIEGNRMIGKLVIEF